MYTGAYYTIYKTYHGRVLQMALSILYAPSYTWGTCSLPLSLTEQSSVHVRIRLNGREPCRFLKQQTHGSPSTCNQTNPELPPFRKIIWCPPSIFKGTKPSSKPSIFRGPLKFLSWHTEFEYRIFTNWQRGDLASFPTTQAWSDGCSIRMHPAWSRV